MQRTNKALDTGLALLTRHRVTSRGVLRSLGRRVSKMGLCAPRNQLKRERERKKDTGTQALMEQRCFNDLSVSIYRLLYKEFLLTVIKIRKTKRTATIIKETRN